MKEKKSIKEIIKAFIAFVLILVIIFLLVIDITIIIERKKYPDKIPTVFGYIPIIVIADTMEPEIENGDLIIVKRVKEETINKGDIIILISPTKQIATIQRVVGIEEGIQSKFYVIKSDNESEEAEIKIIGEQIQGKYIKRYPKLGEKLLFIITPWGRVLFVGTVFLIGLVIVYTAQSGESMYTELKEKRSKK